MSKKQIRIDQEVKEAFNQAGIDINAMLKALKESSDPGGVEPSGDATSAASSGRTVAAARKSSTPLQTVSNDTHIQGPTNQECADYCHIHGHQEGEVPGTHVTELDGPGGYNGQPIIRVYCGRCKTTTTHKSRDTDADSKPYTFVVEEPTLIRSYHP